jgi:hypothetical protein
MAVNRTGTGDPHLWPQRSGGRQSAILLLREEPTQSAGKKIARRRCGEEAVSGADPTSTGPLGRGYALATWRIITLIGGTYRC